VYFFRLSRTPPKRTVPMKYIRGVPNKRHCSMTFVLKTNKLLFCDLYVLKIFSNHSILYWTKCTWATMNVKYRSCSIFRSRFTLSVMFCPDCTTYKRGSRRTLFWFHWTEYVRNALDKWKKYTSS
jgi:hypothetical protein